MIWNGDRREFNGILTIRNILELIISLCGTLQIVLSSDEAKSQSPKDSVRQVTEKFLEKNVLLTDEDQTQSQSILSIEDGSHSDTTNNKIPRAESSMISSYNLDLL